jgi:hypothetical protein
MVVLALGLFAGGALAEDPAAQKEALAHNKASNAALDAGDVATATREAEAAWRAAERGWGDNANTAELAMQVTVNYLDLGNPAAAREPAERALALARYAKSYTEAEARLWHGMSLAGDPSQRAELQAALAALDAKGVVNEDTVRGRLMLAALQISESPQTASATAQKAITDGRAIQSPSLRMHLFESGKIQYLAGEFGLAAFTLTESLNLWEQQPVGELPKALGDAWAWQVMALEASRRSMPKDAAPPPGGRFGAFGRRFAPPLAFLPKRDEPTTVPGARASATTSGCELEYEDAELPPFPKVEGDKARLAAAVVMFDIDNAGATTNVRIVGSAPAAEPPAGYEEAIRQRVTARKVRSFVRESCRAGRMETIVYDF